MKVSFKSSLLILAVILLLTTPLVTMAQVVWAGLKMGAHLNIAKNEDGNFKDSVNIHPVIGGSIGAVLLFKVKDRYFLHTEYLYTTKGKDISGKIDPNLKDQVRYHYFEVPILFSMQFKGHLGTDKNYKFFLGAGPNIAYLLSARGKIKSGELLENNISSLSYKVEFHKRTDRDHNDIIYYPSAKRLQFGINIGLGVILEPIPKHKIIVDMRYCFDQTMFSKKSADYLVPHDYDDNLRFRNRNFRVSLAYLLEYNLSKKERHKGKSSIKL